ncbi:DNA cytosine methyltransferase [Paraburkholderia sp.]|uniref:DNA (cytosine-5-)-methyltransferase n=1 Tax=Paraburkholderia sp. TaxID=1926495 RepID=UPI0023860393|nr:DNA cytosine methyltransferase [Paraburkholderia sp.]MDE1179445.1 DNA cytosine methyltransferase [Paraburkholderia sp.]
MELKFGSVCSGIEAASCAWNPLGWRAQFVSEIEPFPCAVLAHHHASVPNLGDMTKFKDWPDATLDLLVGGTPCQSFSVAGLRKGLADPRGNLMLTYLAIAERFAPRWLVWENVPGVLSSNGGRDFGTLLGGLAELGYGFAYRVLDAQFFGVAQRRRRVFVVGHLGDWRRAAAVLFERESLLGHPAPRRETGKGVAPTLSARTKGGGGLGTDFECDGGLIPGVARALTTSNQRIDAETETLLVAHPLRAQSQPSHRADSDTYVPVSYAIPAGATRENPDSGPDGIGVQSDIAYTLEARAEVQAIAFDCKASGQNGFGVGEIASTMRSMGHSNSHQNGGGHLAVALDLKQITSPHNRSRLEPGSPSPTMAKGSEIGVAHGSAVRRLTPRECERLQGFADDYTRVTVRGKPAADGPRYKALGNSMAVPVMAWIGRRIELVESHMGSL